MSARTVFSLVKTTLVEWSEDRAPRMGAALAYYTVFSLAPLLIISISIAGFVFGEEAARGEVFDVMHSLVGPEGAAAVQAMVDEAAHSEGRGTAAVVGIGVLLFGASNVFAQLQAALNQIWKVAPKKRTGLVNFLKTRLLSMGMVLGIGFLLMVSLLLSAAIAAAGTYLEALLPGTETAWSLFHTGLSLAVFTFLFGAIYKILPDARIRWHDVWIGALVTAVLFSLGRYLIGIYIGNAAIGSVYGAAGSIIILLVWVYYSAQILFFGAEFTQVYASRHGGIQPERYAVRVVKEEVR